VIGGKVRLLALALALGLAALLAALPADARGRLGTSAESVTNTAQVLLSPVPVRTITFCVIQGGAAQEDVIFRGVGGSPVYATVTVNAGQVVGRALNAAIPAAGLEVVTSTPAGDVTVECTYRLGS
jgi:hypothetical protein